MPTRIWVLICAYDCRSYLVKALASVRTQDHPDVRVVVIDDCSPDERQRDLVQDLNKLNGWTGHVNDERRFCPRNLWDAFQLADPDGEDIVFILDGDDWISDSGALSRLAAVYDNDPEVWCTFGGYKPEPPDPGCHVPQPYPVDVIRHGTYRTHHLHEWNHAITAKAWLWRASLTEADMMFDDGVTWFSGAYDQSLFPLLERAGHHQRCITDDCFYAYRSDSPVADAIIHRTEVMDASRVILSRPAKPPIDPMRPAPRASVQGRGRTARPVKVRRA